MKRPEVIIENYQDVYSFYKDYEPSRIAKMLLSGALSVHFAPRQVVYAEGAKQNLYDMQEQGRTVVIAANHTKATDPCVISSMSAREKALRFLLWDKTFIPAKSPIFHDYAPEHPLVSRLLRRAVDSLGAKPIFREDDYPDHPLLPAARRHCLDLCNDMLEEGQYAGIFPEEKRNEGDPAQLQPLKSGLGYMVCKVSKIQQPSVLPIGFYYGNEKSRPTACVGNPSIEPFARSRYVMAWTAEVLQDCVDIAVEAHNLNNGIGI